MLFKIKSLWQTRSYGSYEALNSQTVEKAILIFYKQIGQYEPSKDWKVELFVYICTAKLCIKSLC